MSALLEMYMCTAPGQGFCMGSKLGSSCLQDSALPLKRSPWPLLQHSLRLRASEQLASSCSALNAGNRAMHRVQESHSGQRQTLNKILVSTEDRHRHRQIWLPFAGLERSAVAHCSPDERGTDVHSPFTFWAIGMSLKSGHYLDANRSCQCLQYSLPRWLQVNYR